MIHRGGVSTLTNELAVLHGHPGRLARPTSGTEAGVVTVIDTTIGMITDPIITTLGESPPSRLVTAKLRTHIVQATMKSRAQVAIKTKFRVGLAAVIISRRGAKGLRTIRTSAFQLSKEGVKLLINAAAQSLGFAVLVRLGCKNRDPTNDYPSR
jgi:hypothetical protein